jgi:hypothetical protein
MLGSVLTDTAQGTLAWSHWERGPGRPQAVFTYKIPQAKSHYRVELGLEYRDHPAYHGEFAVDPESGTILRLTMEAELEKSSVANSPVLLLRMNSAQATVGRKISTSVSRRIGRTGDPARLGIKHIGWRNPL